MKTVMHGNGQPQFETDSTDSTDLLYDTVPIMMLTSVNGRKICLYKG